MKQNPNFVLKYLADIPYLLPYGQMIANHYRGTKINSTGVYLWNLLANDKSMDAVLSEAEAYFEPEPQEQSTFRQEIIQFLDTLISYGIIIKNADLPNNYQDIKYLTIAGLHLQLTNFHTCFPGQLHAFITEAVPNTDMTIYFHADLPPYIQNGRMLLRNHELNVMELADEFILTLPQNPEILEIHIAKDGTRSDIYSMPTISDEYKEKLFHALRLPFLYLAQLHGMAAIHSASILYENKAWLFSAPSGTGKSTHTDLWSSYLNTKIINGDLNLLAFEKEAPMIHGIPWCGTSGIFDTCSYPLGGIILLKQAPTDSIKELKSDEKQLLISQRFISPSWTADLFDKNIQLAGKIASNSLVCRLYCTKKKTAIKTMKTRIDKYLEDAQ